MCRDLVILFRHHGVGVDHLDPVLDLPKAAIYTGLPANLKLVRKADCVSLIFAPR